MPRSSASPYFNPRSPHGERRAPLTLVWPWEAFQSTLPARGATDVVVVPRLFLNISIHAPRTGSDAHGHRHRLRQRDFNPRSPHGERRDVPFSWAVNCPISIHAPRTGSDKTGARPEWRQTISIHAPRTGSAPPRGTNEAAEWHFNPRSPHGERREPMISLFGAFVFQSTLPARGATKPRPRDAARTAISIHAPRTGSDGRFVAAIYEFVISIHAPRTGSDFGVIQLDPTKLISIHAPRTGSDDDGRTRNRRKEDFNPRSPHGERHAEPAERRTRQYFNPRSPHGERRVALARASGRGNISTHAPRTGSDPCCWRLSTRWTNFNPRSPHGERHDLTPPDERRSRFQPTLPARGATHAQH